MELDGYAANERFTGEHDDEEKAESPEEEDGGNYDRFYRIEH